MINKIVIATAAVTLSILILLVFRDVIAPILQFVLWVIAGLFVLGGFGLVYIGWEYILRTRNERKQSQYQAHQDGFGMLHLLNVATGIVENLSTYPGTHHNGTWEEPHPAAAAAWAALVAKRGSETPTTYLLPPEQKQQLDLMAIMTQPTQCYSIIAGQQVGKTHIADKIASYWSIQALSNLMIEKPVIIGPKWDRGEWEGCNKVGGKYDYGKVLAGLNAVKKLAESRHADEKLSHKQHPIQPIFIDDWTHIRRELGSIAEDFVNEATVLYASVNIILYFILHADTNGAYGTDKIGAALHQNFYKLFIEPGYDNAGLIDRSKNVGWLQRPGQSKKDRQQVPLFTQTGRQMIPVRTVEPDLVIHKATDKELEVVRLWESGEHDEGRIARKVYGDGGRQLELAKKAINKFCR